MTSLHAPFSHSHASTVALLTLLASCTLSVSQVPAPHPRITPAQLTQAEAAFNSPDAYPDSNDSNLHIFLEAADQGSAAAKRDLGLLYQSSDHELALQWFEAAAVAGDIRASSYIGDFYLDPKNGRPDPATALFWYQKSLHATDARGTLALARLYCSGTGVPQSAATCGTLLDQAHQFQKPTDPTDVNTDLGHAELTLGDLFRNGHTVPRDATRAAAWYAKSAALGSIPGAIAQSKLYVEPNGLPQNLPRAVAILDAITALAIHPSDEPWFDASRPSQSAIANMYIEIGAIYEARGSSAFALAIPVYRKAAALGNGSASIALGQRLATGDRTPRNIPMAYEVLHGLTDLHLRYEDRFPLAKALQSLSTDYATGNGTSVDRKRANELANAAMQQRIPMAAAESAMAAPEPMPSMTERYPNLQAPDTVPTQQEFAVNVSLNAVQFDAKTQTLSGQQDNGKLQITLPAGMSTLPIQVDLIAPGMTFVDGSNTGTIILDANRDNSTPAIFHLRSGSAPANGVLLATLSYHQNFIAQLERAIVITASNTSAANTTNPAAAPLTKIAPVPPSPPITKMAAPPRLAPVVLDPTAKSTDLTVTETLVGDTMYYAFDSPGLAGSVFAVVPFAAATRAKIDQAYGQLQSQSSILASGSGAACAAARAKVSHADSDPDCSDSLNARALAEGIGNDLFDNMAPQAFRDIYQLLTSHHIRLHTITVVTNSPTLPWELMRPRASDGTRDFLGLTAAIVRENMASPQLAQPANVEFTGLAVVAPNYGSDLHLNGSTLELKALQADFPNLQQVAGDSTSVSKLVQDAPQGIIHFTGHGQRVLPHAAAPTPATGGVALAPQVAIALEDESMTPATFVALREDGKSAHPFYFFNACDLGRSDPQLNYIDGWAPALMQSGASGYLGALYEVGDQSAVSFATHFYRNLKNDLAGNSNWAMADLVTEARRSTYAEASDPSALAYVLYAKPFMKLVAADQNAAQN